MNFKDPRKLKGMLTIMTLFAYSSNTRNVIGCLRYAFTG